MRLLELTERRPLLAAAAAGCLLGGVIGVLWPLPETDAAAIQEESLPIPPPAAMQRYSEADFAKLRDGRSWAGSTTGQEGAATVGSWRLLGVVTRPLRAALVEVSQKQVRIVEGQPLPDGTLLRNVSSRGIEFERDNCRFGRSLYSPEDVPIPTSGCPATSNANSQTGSNPIE